MSTFASKARAIASYYRARRQRGHSTVQREGYANRPDATLVVARNTRNNIIDPNARPFPLSLYLDDFEGFLGRQDGPLVVEHAALQLLFEGLLAELDTAELGRSAREGQMATALAEIAHRDRALRHLAEVLSFVRGEYSIHELVDNAMRVTASGRPAERPLGIITTSDIAPLLKALDELACALRGVTKPKPEVPS